jgi:hypothetical protein
MAHSRAAVCKSNSAASAQIAGNRGHYRPPTVTIHRSRKARCLPRARAARPQAKKNPARGGAKSGRKRPNRTNNLCFARLGGRIVTGALCPRSCQICHLTEPFVSHIKGAGKCGEGPYRFRCMSGSGQHTSGPGRTQYPCGRGLPFTQPRNPLGSAPYYKTAVPIELNDEEVLAVIVKLTSGFVAYCTSIRLTGRC